MKLIVVVPPTTNVAALYVKLKILPLETLYIYDVGMFMYQYDNAMLTVLIVGMFTPVRNIHDYNTRVAAKHHLYVTFHGTNRNKKCIRQSGAHVWNFMLTKMNPHFFIKAHSTIYWCNSLFQIWNFRNTIGSSCDWCNLLFIGYFILYLLVCISLTHCRMGWCILGVQCCFSIYD